MVTDILTFILFILIAIPWIGGIVKKENPFTLYKLWYIDPVKRLFK